MRGYMRATPLLLAASLVLAAGSAVAAAPDDDAIDVSGGNAVPAPPQAAAPAPRPAPPRPASPRVVRRLPPPDENAAPGDLLVQARDAAGGGRDWVAAEWLERAETRLLARAALPRQAGEPDASPVIEDIDAARSALSRHDRQTAVVRIDAALGRLAPPASDSASAAAPPVMAQPPAVAAPSSLAMPFAVGVPSSVPPPFVPPPSTAAPMPPIPQLGPPGAPPQPAKAAGIQGQWRWNGVGYVFVPPPAQVTAQSRPAPPLRAPVRTNDGDWQWRDGAWVWSPNGG